VIRERKLKGKKQMHDKLKERREKNEKRAKGEGFVV